MLIFLKPLKKVHLLALLSCPWFGCGEVRIGDGLEPLDRSSLVGIKFLLLGIPFQLSSMEERYDSPVGLASGIRSPEV
jgi:hypothetical protein